MLFLPTKVAKDIAKINWDNILTSTWQILTIAYTVTTPLKFFVFYRKYDKLCNLMKSIKQKMKENSIKNAKKNEKRLVVPLLVIVGITAVIDSGYFYGLFVDAELNFTGLALPMMPVLTGISSEFTSILLQFTFMNISTHICSLLNQIADELEGMKFIRDEIRIKEIFTELCEFHNEVQVDTSELLKCYEDVFKVIVIANIWMIAQAAIFMLDSMWVELILYVPFLLFEIWIYCYACQTIINKVVKL
jgi:hypothetical protein